MKIKNISATIVIVSLFLIYTITTAAQEIVVTTKTRSAYLGGNGALFCRHTAQVTDINFKWKNGTFVNFWTSIPTNNEKSFCREGDITFGKSDRIGKVSFSGDVNYYFVLGKDVVNANGEVDREFGSGKTKLSAFVRVEAYSPTKKGGPRKGLMGIVGAKSNIAVAPRLTLSLKAQLKKDSGNFGFDSGLLGQGRIDGTLKINDKINFLGGLNFSTPLSHMRDGRGSHAVLEFGMAYKIK